MTKVDKLNKILVGATIKEVIEHNSHGEVLEFRLTDAKGVAHKLCICTYEGTIWDDNKPNHRIRNNVCVTDGDKLIDWD